VDYVVWDRKTPWRQGKLIAADDCIRLKLCSEEESVRALVIVASHDCDLAQPLDVEPRIEIILGKKAAVGDGNLFHAKNVRRLQVSFDGETQTIGEFEAIHKATVSKADLAGCEPRKDLVLSTENIVSFQIWLASRYRRSAFPDEFEDRLKINKLANKIASAVKPHGEDITGVFFDVDEGIEVARLGPDDTYLLDIVILHRAEPNFEKSLKAAEEVQQQIEKAFQSAFYTSLQKWQHIELRYCEVSSEEALTYKRLKELKRWRLDHMSLAAIPQQATVSE
jgi:hypothetical protein